VSCPNCGHDARAGSGFCNGCGAKLVVTCASCGATPPPGSRFCNGCGATLGAAPANAPPARAPRDYTPKHLADKILTSRSALEGERKQVTVVFADVKGSMELAEQLDPEEWHRILERFFEILTEGVHRFEGTVNQYTGDGIMALFGAPIAHEDHAQRACYAALHLRGELRRYADELRVSRGLNLVVRMGLNSGDVVVGKIGDDLRMDYTAQGHTVGLAQRMESIAESGQAFVTANTARLVEGYFELRDLGTTPVKGSRDPVRVYALEGVGAHRTRLDLSRARGFSKFVGRASDMATLEAALERGSAGRGAVVGVVAEAGTGKSRLCFEFLERCRARGLPVYEAHALARRGTTRRGASGRVSRPDLAGTRPHRRGRNQRRRHRRGLATRRGSDRGDRRASLPALPRRGARRAGAGARRRRRRRASAQRGAPPLRRERCGGTRRARRAAVGGGPGLSGPDPRRLGAGS
jgi:class 3 adenylate cyclase